MIGAWIDGSRNGAEAELAPCPRPASRSCACSARRRAGWPPSGDELVERGIERDDDVRRRREAPLRRLLHVRPLVVQVERERRASCLRMRSSTLASHEHEAHAGRAFDALARRRDQRVERRRARVDRQRAERAHRVDDQAPAVARDDGRDLGQRIQDAGRRLAVDEADMRDRRVLREQAVDVVRRSSARRRRSRTSTSCGPSSA